MDYISIKKLIDEFVLLKIYWIYHGFSLKKSYRNIKSNVNVSKNNRIRI